jgi:hypothetical protein
VPQHELRIFLIRCVIVCQEGCSKIKNNYYKGRLQIGLLVFFAENQFLTPL